MRYVSQFNDSKRCSTTDLFCDLQCSLLSGTKVIGKTVILFSLVDKLNEYKKHKSENFSNTEEINV